jgi:16S rRNA processing protein RimM
VFENNSISVGYLFKSHGIHGELVWRTQQNIGEEILEQMESIFLSIDGLRVPFFLEQIVIRSAFDFVIKLEDVDSEADAQKLIGREVLLEASLFENSGSSSQYEALIGFIAKTAQGAEIGKILRVEQFPQQVMWIVSRNDNELLIPAIDSWIIKSDTQNKTIELDLPEGLIDLNRA